MFAVFAPSLVSAQESSTYTVKEGDTLSEIAETHNTTVEKLAENNIIDNIHMIYVGQELVIDGPVQHQLQHQLQQLLMKHQQLKMKLFQLQQQKLQK